MDRNCTLLTVCADGYYEKTVPTYNTDRVCTGMEGPTVEVKEINSDAIELRWTAPVLARSPARSTRP